jgi:type IV secretory pathway protease TraF
MIAWRPTPWLVWNNSESVPVGLYQVHRADKLVINDLVLVIPPEPIATFLADRGYLQQGLPLLKHIRAVANQTVCRVGDQITIDGADAGRAQERDYRGRPLQTFCS